MSAEHANATLDAVLMMTQAARTCLAHLGPVNEFVIIVIITTMQFL